MFFARAGHNVHRLHDGRLLLWFVSFVVSFSLLQALVNGVFMKRNGKLKEEKGKEQEVVVEI